jgi:hypothetical protein
MAGWALTSRLAQLPVLRMLVKSSRRPGADELRIPRPWDTAAAATATATGIFCCICKEICKAAKKEVRPRLLMHGSVTTLGVRDGRSFGVVGVPVYEGKEDFDPLFS